MKIVHEWNLRFPEKIKQEQTTEFSEILNTNTNYKIILGYP